MSFPERLQDACGVVLAAERDGQPGSRVLPLTLEALGRLAHRGGVDADGRTGDGAGVLTAIPFDLFQPEISGLSRSFAVGAFFLPAGRGDAGPARRMVEECLAAHELIAAAWRTVPTDSSVLGKKARSCLPRIEHLFVLPRVAMIPAELEGRLARARAGIEKRGGPYVVSLSSRTIVYKALVRAVDLAAFYPDLRHRDFRTSFAIGHQRFSTNTFPSWPMAQPFRMLAHNGEINTIAGNRNWMRARGFRVRDGESDSASLDAALATLVQSGREVRQALTMLIPPAWENDPRIDGQARTLLDAQASLMEPWDGPALVAFSDGRTAGAALDRNGLRPARYQITSDGLLALASEAGVFDLDETSVVQQGRLGPGEMIGVDLEQGGLWNREDVFECAAQTTPPAMERTTIDEVRRITKKQAPFVTRAKERDLPASPHVLRAFGYTRDELQHVLAPMYREGVEPIASMGDDTPLAVLSSRPRLLFSYFKQRFAQVTNPPIDPLREALVMSLETRLGRGASHVLLPSPLLRRSELRALLSWQHGGWSVRSLSLLFGSDMRTALDDLLAAAVRAVREGATCLVLSDRGIDVEHAAVPSLLAMSAVHQQLIREGLRLQTSLIADAGDTRDDHHLAALIAFGADAVCPWLALELISGIVGGDSGSHDEAEKARWRYRRALTRGLLKILSKMGVSTVSSYRGAQLFEAVGLSSALIDAHFPGTPSCVEGVGLDEIAGDVLERQAAAFSSDQIDDAGIYRFRNGGESHAWEPRVAGALHRDYDEYSELVRKRRPIVLRDLLEFRTPSLPLPIDTVEPLASIAPRFMTSAMSLGALSPEAQRTLAVAMNRLGGRSNSGEGGELAMQPRRASHRIKQVASARFGVTAQYLAGADELQIKIAQGSKPGEGGHLPGEKVTPLIAGVRHASPGTPLISPPPHHDIYSIEDLAQLVADLKQVNPAATVSVKLVSSAGIGTIAVGVAKAYADAIEISGHDGGTGASPVGSIRNAGTPWELGLAEAHQALVRAGLRDRVRLQVNGGLKSGRDVVIAALLGAEEFGFGTAPLVAMGCSMARQCHLNTCPTGIATQREELRRRFKGTPGDVIRFFSAVGEEVRQILARLGVRELRAVIGRSDLLAGPSNDALSRTPRPEARAATLRLDTILGRPSGSRSDGPPVKPEWSRGSIARNDPPEPANTLDAMIVRSRRRVVTLPITNADRAVGAGVAGHIARHGRREFRLSFHGAAGQSFGAFCVDGMGMDLDGVANDGVGKGMSGGQIAIRASRVPNAVLAGNAILYGATGGRMFIAGRVGERFAVRNSGACAVVEGAGDHACEYMTAGVVVILGPAGVNVGAGMTGGILFVAGEPWINADSVAALALSPSDDPLLRDLLIAHRFATGSQRALALLDDWSYNRLLFRRIIPIAAIPVKEDAVASTASR